MLRAAILALTFVTAVAAFAIWRTSEPVHTLRTPELGPAPVAVRTMEETREAEPSGIRVGSFQKPETVPNYEILEENLGRGEEVRITRLLVDTRSRREPDFELIAQDLKARYAEYDAVTVEFTDAGSLLDYNGGALIFNTPEGAYYMGFYYGPPNAEGYYVRAAE